MLSGDEVQGKDHDHLRERYSSQFNAKSCHTRPAGPDGPPFWAFIGKKLYY
ncbi:hypothetical protein Ppa06_63930 [Planomonospora parontospora subsp. parontospora]|uniref:Uncharacterized protein n=2 Tax=Planomonospora parontospora TaxID=58119 RepID=A0AA37BN04_9ACTN|nr:hypothetical protein [Planomonospora parontospora]GGK95553.1 hypothetical protein GCM10010126_63690 [Planomonospora parontospora]GII12595.1 hypothetical protein Ppa06_63930 [Planomonospora parontospora subsp. parontospora]